MALTDILAQVRADGEAKADKIARETSAEVETIIEQARQEARSHHEKELEIAKKTISSLKVQELPTARLGVEREKLIMVNELLDDVRRKAMDKLDHLPAKERRKLYRKLLDSAGPVEGRLRCPKKRARELEQMTGLSLGEPLNEPGLIIEGDFERLDLRLGTLVDTAWADHLKEVYQTLLDER